MKQFLFSTLFLFAGHLVAFAEEGMLIPSLIQAFESDMKAKGMKLTADQIYSVNHSSLKDAILQFGGGCTAEVVSSKGLILTNHHCGYSQIQSHSSLEKDYLKNGFWAKNLGEELPNPGLTAMRIVRIDDVTKAVMFGVEGENAEEIFRKNVEQLIKDATMNTHYTAEVKAFNYGNDFYLMLQETFKDVRFVGTPPNSIGKFGGDTDNWVWPRHTGDFSVFRIYAGPDNKPAEYSKDNVPYSPIEFLKISFKDRKPGDFTMVYGFPGSTEQHVVSAYLKFIVEKERPARIAMREKSLSVIDAGMRSSDEIRIKYSAKQASIANAYKKWIGQIDGLKRLDGVAVKEAYELEYMNRAMQKDAWKQDYSPLVALMNNAAKKNAAWEFEYAMNVEYLYYGPELFKLCRNIDDLVTNYTKYAENDQLAAQIDKQIKSAEGFFKNFDYGVDRKIFELLTAEFFKQLELPMEAGIDVNEMTESVYETSVFHSKEVFISFLKKFKSSSVKKLKKDPFYQYYGLLMKRFNETVKPAFYAGSDEMTYLLKEYVKGKYEMFPDEKHWADANSTLRITYGQLEGSSPTDGLSYTEHTTLDGIVAKYNSGNPDFELLPRMLELHKEKNYGKYAQGDELWVCFTGSNHTTGGNSGSPVLDENGYLMGLNFDRSWESTMSDYMFDASRCRNIVVDIRYVMWVMDVYAGAGHLVDEMEMGK
ncbi:MAG: S46 family peptidase [Bacteroidota bacterium]